MLFSVWHDGANDATTMQLQAMMPAAAVDPISGRSVAIGLSYGPIGIVRWLSSGGGKEEVSQKMGGAEAILGSHQW
jgi:hypothetical protein